MQKRTNPLALKEEAAKEGEIRRDRPVASKSQTQAPKVAEEPMKTTQAIPSAPAKQAAPATVSRIKKASEFSKPALQTLDVAEPDLTDDWLESVVLDEEEQMEQDTADTAVAFAQAPTSFVPTVKRDDVPEATEVIEDEKPFPTMEDFELASRFSLRGNVSRRIVLGTVSRDVCRLAQLLHPEQKLSTIIENALMTRIFLENPEAFDAMAAVIEEKGGRIKC